MNSVKLRFLEGIAMFREFHQTTFSRRYCYLHWNSYLYKDLRLQKVTIALNVTVKKDVFHGFSKCVQVSLLFFSNVTVYTFSTGFFTDLPHTLFLFGAGTRTFLGSFFSELVFCFREDVVFVKVSLSRRCSVTNQKRRFLKGAFTHCIQTSPVFSKVFQ